MNRKAKSRAKARTRQPDARIGGLVCGLLLLAGLGDGVPLAAQINPPSAAVAGQWTWMSGSSSSDPSGHYGGLGVPDGVANFPGGRWGATSWVDNNGNLWLFGGFGYGDAATFGYLNDLWEFNPSTGFWTWMGGDKTFNANYCGDSPTYGPLGSFAAGNFPGGRQNAASWTDKDGNLWLFGGEGDGFGAPGSGGACGGAFSFGYLNDLWEFNPKLGTNGEWAWMGGSNTPSASGVYPATLNTFAPGNVPGARFEASTWTDSSGNFWLFGGEGYDANGNFGELNDLWQFNPLLNEWAWMGGSNTVPAYSGQPGMYGTLGSPGATNIPGGRYGASAWTDSSGNLWLFGGEGLDGTGNGGGGYLNDLWEFNRLVGEYGEWAWMGGSGTANQSGVYGALGTPAAENIPSGRYDAVSWIDSNGHFWLFGGTGIGTGGVGTGFLYDLWAFDSSTNQWVWMDGSSLVNQSGVYSPLYTPASANIPGGRTESTSWTDKDGNLWLFGGDGRDSGGSLGALSDLWVYPPPGISFGGPPPAATPVFSVPSGTYVAAQTVSITDATPGATIYYTTNGTTPTTSSSAYNSGSPINVSSTESLEAIATASGYSTSAVGTAVYTITPPAATPTFLPGAGTYASAQMVTISDATPQAIIFYTTNGTAPSFTGTTPNPGTTLYVGQITVSSTETIEAIATALGYSSSPLATAPYTIVIAPAQVTDNEVITVTDAETFPDVVDTESITVTDSEVVRAFNAIAIAPTAASFNANSGNGYATYGYTSVPFTATGGIGTLTLTEAGALPASFTFVNGVLSGTPAVSSLGTYPFSVTATDADGDAVTVQGYTLTIQAASAYPAMVMDNETITVTDTETFPDVADSETITVTDTETVTTGPIITTTGTLGGGEVNMPYTSPAFTASGGTGTYTWSAAGLPAGLSINAGTGVLSGTPTVAGVFAVTVTVTDLTGLSNSVVFSLTVAAPLLTISANPTSLTIAQGSSGETTLTFTPTGGYNGTLTLSCTGLPANSLCTFTLNGASISSLTLPGNNLPVSVLLTIETDVNAQQARMEPRPTPLRPGAILTAIAFWWPGTLLGLFALRRKRKLFTKDRGWLGLCLCALLIGTLASLAGCNHGGGHGAYVTPVGNSTVTITVTPGAGSGQTLSLGVTITKQ